ncbi:hypothetical protein TrLO_g15691 [Triparma laevis f. longispina]|uniref:Calmodulin n=1 Tax=Triparma laevis f. longispina TaxID=1714387 RepID=A0A9W7KV17_9STRA|nr:hypothetical protein TrLO_g15691 [Triparma laevis f. longispina]
MSEVVWYSYATDDGIPYYINSVTQESRWDPPTESDGIVSPTKSLTDEDPTTLTNNFMNDTVISDNAVVADSFIDDTIDVDVSELQIDQFDTETGPSSPQTQALEALGWVKYTTDSGDPYFYNLQEQTTQWTVPEDVLEREAELISTGKYGQGPASTTTMGTRRHAKSVTAVDNPSIEYDYDRARLSPASFSPGFNNSLNPNSASSFRASSRGQGKVSFANATANALGDSVMKASDLDISDYENLDQTAMTEARKGINPITISKIRKRFRAASYTFGGANWDKVFGQFDTSGDGALDAEEFFLAVRAGLKIPPREVTDRDVEIILKALDMNGDGKIDLIEFASFLQEEDPVPEDRLLKRSIVGLRPAASKSDFNTSTLTHSELMMVGGAKPSLEKAKLAKEELTMQRRAREIAEKKKRGASARGLHSAKMAAKILNVVPVKDRLDPRNAPRGQRKPNKTWTKQAHRLKIANAVQKMWKCTEVRHAAYEKLLGNVDKSLSEAQKSYQIAHKQNKRSHVTPSIMESLRKKLKSYSYTTNGPDYVKLFNIFDNDRTGSVTFHRWLQVMRKTCKFPKYMLNDGDVLEIFQTIAGENKTFIDQVHLLKFIKTDVPAALSMSTENNGKVSQGEVLMYIIEKAKKRLKQSAYNAKVTDWNTVFKLYDSDGNGSLDYNEFSRIFRLDLKLTKKELHDDELKLVFNFIDDDMSQTISAVEFGRFLHSGESERRFPVVGDDTVYLTETVLKMDIHASHERQKVGRMSAHHVVAAQEDAQRKLHVKTVVEKIRKRARAYCYSISGQDFNVVFSKFDKSHDSYISPNEFRIGARKIFKIPPLELNDSEIMDVFKLIANNQKGENQEQEGEDEWISKDSFCNFMGKEDSSNDEYAAAWQHTDKEKERRRIFKSFGTKVKKRAYASHRSGQDFEAVFRMFDQDASGTLTYNELNTSIRRFLHIPEEELSRRDIMVVFKMLDNDRNGEVSIDEFLEALS